MLTGAYAGSLWTFSLGFYALDGVSARLIEWQDRDDLDVNIVLCLCWHAGRGLNLDADAINKMVTAVEPWRSQVIAPVRAVRRALKAQTLLRAMPDADALRKQLLQFELSLERSVQQRLQMLSEVQAQPSPVGVGASARERFANMLSTYARGRNVQLPEAEQSQLADHLQDFVDSGKITSLIGEKPF